MSNQSVSNARVTFDELMAISERTGIEDISPRVEGDSPAKGTARSRTSSGETSWTLERRLQAVANPSVPSVPKSLPQKVIKTLMQAPLDMGRVLPIGALPRDVLDPRAVSKKGRALANFTTNEMVFSHFAKDGAFTATAKQLTGVDFADDAEFEEFVAGMHKSTEYIGSSGTMTGLLTRLVDGITAAPAPKLAETDYTRWARSILTFHPIELDFVGKGVDEMIREVKTSKDFSFNLKSSAGIPYYTKVGAPGVLPTAVKVATMLLNAFAEGSMNTLNTERPSLLAVMLKNKQDIYEIAKLEKKVRPYFVFPLHERLLYSILQCRLKAVRFDQDPSAVSAVGFSWNYGGGDKMYKWIVGRAECGFGFYPLMYGDDQLWVIVLEGGGAYICTPDFSHMDLSLAPVWGKVAFRMWRKAYTRLDRTWESVLKLNCFRAFTRPVVIDGALSYLFKYGLASGIPGTTKFDEVASASANGYIKEKYENEGRALRNVDELQVWLRKLVADIASKFGLVFKEGSMDVYPFVPEEPKYDFVFLGQTLVRVRGTTHLHYIPRPEVSKILLSLTTLKKAYRSTNHKQRSIATRLRSLYAGGGFLYRGASIAMERYFSILEKAGIHPLGMDDDLYGDETEGEIMTEEINFGGDHWPTAEFCLNLYLPPDDNVAEHTGVSVDDRMSSTQHVDLVDFTLDLDSFSEESSDDATRASRQAQQEQQSQALEPAINPKAWIDMEALERSAKDRGDDPPKAPKVVPTKHQAELQPLPQAVKDAHDKAREEERAKIREERPARYQTPFGKPIKPKGTKQTFQSGRSGAAIHEGDFDYLEEQSTVSDLD